MLKVLENIFEFLVKSVNRFVFAVSTHCWIVPREILVMLLSNFSFSVASGQSLPSLSELSGLSILDVDRGFSRRHVRVHTLFPVNNLTSPRISFLNNILNFWKHNFFNVLEEFHETSMEHTTTNNFTCGNSQKSSKIVWFCYLCYPSVWHSRYHLAFLSMFLSAICRLFFLSKGRGPKTENKQNICEPPHFK